MNDYLWDRSGEAVCRMARVWSRLVLRATGVRMNVTYEEPLDPELRLTTMSAPPEVLAEQVVRELRGRGIIG